MQAIPVNDANACHYELRFRSLYEEGRGYSFPCNPSGEVEMGAMSERARLNYLFARAMVGREFFLPEVQPTLH